MIWQALFGGQTVQVRADVDIEQSFDSFHAHAVPDGIDIRPGDVVLVHGVPSHVQYGERLTCTCDATVQRAGAIGRFWTQLTGLLELTELYEVGFQPKETP